MTFIWRNTWASICLELRYISLPQVLFCSHHLLKHNGDNKADELPFLSLLAFDLEWGGPSALAFLCPAVFTCLNSLFKPAWAKNCRSRISTVEIMYLPLEFSEPLPFHYSTGPHSRSTISMVQFFEKGLVNIRGDREVQGELIFRCKLCKWAIELLITFITDNQCCLKNQMTHHWNI